MGTVENLPLPDATFDKALSVHTVYFWQSLEAGCKEIARVLKPGGQIVLGFLPKAHMDRMKMPSDIFTPRDPDDVMAPLEQAGFRMVETRRPNSESGWVVATGTRADDR